MNTRDWAAYTETLQQIAAIRRQSAQTDAQRTGTLQQAQADVDTLTQRLAAQRARIQTLAPMLRVAPPYLDHVEAATAASITEAITRAAQATERAETEARNAETDASRPPLLPTASPAGRAALVYAGWCLLAWMAQCVLILVSGTNLSAALWSICGLPALAFFGGFISLQLFGQPRLWRLHPLQPAPGRSNLLHRNAPAMGPAHRRIHVHPHLNHLPANSFRPSGRITPKWPASNKSKPD